ncbi:MAG: hypothetical protein IPK13_05060 [Deltaproteobacteria bacterium]|nr:hypothetical protein [Deltaproteobacteria bacterium]
MTPTGLRSRLVWVLFGLAFGFAGCTQSSTPWTPEVSLPEPDIVKRSMTFTSSDDFRTGVLTGLNTDTSGELQMSSGLALYETPFIWVPNSTARTVTRVDTKTLEVSGPFPLINDAGVDCYNPSRTTVDIDGNVWVGCRGNASYVNRDQVEPASVPVSIDNKVVKLSRESGAVLLSLEVGHAPRAMALDVRNHLWIGCSVDDTVWEIDGETGHCYRGERSDCDAPAIPVEDFPYGMAVDQRGHLWVMSLRYLTDTRARLTEIDTATGAVLGVYGPYERNGCFWLYGIAIHPLGDIWLGGHVCNDVVRVKGFAGMHPGDGRTYAAGEMIGAYPVGGEQSRGVAVDLDGNVWVASSGTNTASKLNGATGAILAEVNVGVGPIGVGVDAYGNAWVVNRTSNSVHRVNGLDMTKVTEIPVGEGPYTYSDMLGMALRTITHRGEGFSTWKARVDSGTDAPRWKNIHWTALLPQHSQLEVRARCASTESGLATVSWGALLSQPGAMDCGGGSGRWAEVEARFSAPGTASSPVLYDLTVYWDQ